MIWVKQALSQSDPYALAFVDMRMPPGWDGLETIKHLWQVDPNIQIVICSAYSDHSWEKMEQELECSENFLILKKPFEMIEIRQMASALTKKWDLLSNLHALVKKRTNSLSSLYALSNATLEAVKEGILAVGLDGGVLTYNVNFLKQWNISSDYLKREKCDIIFDKLSEQLNEPALFCKKMKAYCEQPVTVEAEVWVLKSGIVFELFTRPQYQENKIIGVVYSFFDFTERKQLEEQLLCQATHDVLTGLPNRALLRDRIKRAMAQAKRFDLFVGVAHLDVDFFKEINDLHGHHIGDLFLKALSERMLSLARESDTVARFEGDEFVVIFASQPSERNLLDAVKRFSENCAKPYLIANQEIQSTVSIGISIYPRDGVDAETLFKNADAALYQAKQSGRNRFQFYLKEFNQYVIQRAVLKAELAHALERNELSLHYQPLVNLQSEKITGLEALLRWKHPQYGEIGPELFIPIAEEAGFIIPIGKWVLRTACQQLKTWRQTLTLPHLKIAVNVSPSQFMEKNFESMVIDVLKTCHLNPQFLELEITESLLIGNIKQVYEKMAQLKAMGVHFALDDFGTGYSSLSYLKYFQFDTVKIDKIFMQQVTQDTADAAIVEAIIALTKNIGINVLAEGVETAEQIEFLKKHHSNEVQGYYFSKPVDAAACTQLLQQDRIQKKGKS